MRAFSIITCAVALTASLATNAVGQSNERLKLTYLTFSGPVQVPGASLPAGRYRFQMADILTGSAHAVQIYSADGKKLYTTFLARPDEKKMGETPKDTAVMFAERPAGAPQAIREWFYPGNPVGEEFVYPKMQAVQIAKANRTSVLATDATDNGVTTGAKIGRVDETGQFSASSDPKDTVVVNAAPPAAPAPPEVVATAGQSARAETTSQAPGTARELPRTASNLGLFALLSGLSLAGAFGLRRFRAGSAF